MRLTLFAILFLLSGCLSHSAIDQSQAQQRSEARIALGLRYLEQGDMLKARKNLDQALLHAPNYFRAQLSLAHYYEQVDDMVTAKHYYQLALKDHSNNGDVLNNYGTFLCKQGRYNNAEHYFLKAIAQPSYLRTSASYENAALCAIQANQTDKAIEYFQRALDYEPNRPQSLLSLAKFEIESGHWDQARARLLKFQQSYGVQGKSMRLLIELEKRAGNSQQE